TVGRSTAMAIQAAGPRPPLGPGATGEDVHRLQHALIVALGKPLRATGAYRASTQSAVAEYQTSRGLPATGVVDDLTWAALQGGGWRRTVVTTRRPGTRPGRSRPRAPPGPGCACRVRPPGCRAWRSRPGATP